MQRSVRSGCGRRSVAVCLALLLTAGLLVTGCASSASGATGLRIVASTDVYGDIAQQIAGTRARVTSIIDEPDQDPHSYEASARNQLALTRADLVIENGGGYDDFVATLLRASGKPVTRIDVSELSGHRGSAGRDLNEHLWYDLPTIVRLAGAIRSALTAKDPDGAASFRRNEITFVAGVRALERTEAAISARHRGEGVAITEPLPLYLTHACGLVDETPPAFSEAVEEGNDVPVRVLKQTLQLFSDHAVKLLVFNVQTSGPQTDQVLSAAAKNHVPAVGFSETLPTGRSYLAWMRDNLRAIEAALA